MVTMLRVRQSPCRTPLTDKNNYAFRGCCKTRCFAAPLFFLHLRHTNKVRHVRHVRPSAVPDIIGNCCFRNNLTDVNPAINRLWQIQSSLPLTVIDSILLSADNQEYGKNQLRQFLYSPRIEPDTYSQLASTHFRNVTIAVITFSSGNGRGSGRW